MDENIKAQWLTALRSGEYKQGKAYLKRVEFGDTKASYCCLGVLCDLAVKAGVVEVADDGVVEYEAVVTSYGDDEVTNMLPRNVVAWACLSESSGLLKEAITPRKRDEYPIHTLWEMNDRGNYSFEEIADVIEQQF